MIQANRTEREKAMPRSMTGFARQETQYEWGSLVCEIRSVNHRYLEPHLRLPEPLRALEPDLRDSLKGALSRGKIEVGFQLTVDSGKGSDIGLNQELVKQLVQAAEELVELSPVADSINPMELLKWPGVIQSREIDTAVIQEAAREQFSHALKQLLANRDREGQELAQFIEQRLASISQKVTKVRSYMPTLINQFREKLHARLESLKVEVEEDRFHQEVVYMAQKCDVAEELDRLDAHLVEVRHTLAQKGPIGRRLDFLMQELNREANTLSSKSITSETSQIAVDLKVLIEQMREQVQNIE